MRCPSRHSNRGSCGSCRMHGTGPLGEKVLDNVLFEYFASGFKEKHKMGDN